MSVPLNETYPRQVLIVGPDPVAASVYREYVETLDGFEVCGAAATAADALRAARRRRADVVLLDLALEGAAALVRGWQAPAVVGVSSVHTVHAAAGLRPLLSSLLLKPFPLEEIAASLERCRR